MKDKTGKQHSNYCECGHTAWQHRFDRSNKYHHAECEGTIEDKREWVDTGDGYSQCVLRRRHCEKSCKQFTPGYRKPKKRKTSDKECGHPVYTLVKGKPVKGKCQQLTVIGKTKCRIHAT